MLREMDFVDDDWAALRWALGSATAVCRHALVARLSDWWNSARRDQWLPRRVARWIESLLPGMAVAVVVWTLSVALLSSLMRASRLPADDVKMAERVFVIVIPEALYLLGAVALWRRHRRVASGILAAGAILITHGVVHFVTSG